MPRILDRYVATELAAPFLMGVAVFTFFLFIDRLYHLTDLVITKGVPFPLVLTLLGYMMPSFLALTLPMAMLVAVLMACGRLTSDLEITALRACGISPLRIFVPILAAAVLVTLLTASLTLWLNPWANGAFQRQLFSILKSRATTGIKERVFSASFGQFTIYVQDISPSQVALKGLLVSDERHPGISRIIVAREGRLLTDEEQGRVTLRFLDGQISEVDSGPARRSRYTAFQLYDMNLPLDSPLATGSRLEKPERDMTLRQLGREIRRLELARQIVTPYRLERHKRFAFPAAAMVFAMVGYPLGIRAQRHGRGVALAVSLAIVVCYYFMVTSLEGLALRGRVPAMVAVWAPAALFGTLGAIMLVGTARGVPRPLARVAWRIRDLVAAARPRRSLPVLALPVPVRVRRASTYILDRYLLREYMKFLGIGLAVGAVLFVVVDLLQNLDRFLRLKPRMSFVLQHFALRLPATLYEGLPMIVLVATVFLFLALTRDRELDAMKAAGISLYRVSLPVLLLAGLLSVGAVTFQETLLPAINARAEELDRVKIRGGLPRHLQKRTQLWYRASDVRFFRLELVDPVARSLDGLMLLELDGNFRLGMRVDARQAQWTGTGWTLTDGATQRYPGGSEVQREPFRRLAVSMPETMEDFTQVQRPPETMSFRELRAYVSKLRESGHQVSKYIVDLYSKLSFPLVHVIMALVAIPFALASPRAGGRAMGVAVALLISVGYWLVHYMAVAFAKADLLPPELAAWTANVVFAGLGTALFLRART